MSPSTMSVFGQTSMFGQTSIFEQMSNRKYQTLKDFLCVSELIIFELI